MMSLEAQLNEAIDRLKKTVSKAKFDEAWKRMNNIPMTDLKGKVACLKAACGAGTVKESARAGNNTFSEHAARGLEDLDEAKREYGILFDESASVADQEPGDDGLTESQRRVVAVTMQETPGLTENEARIVNRYPLNYPEGIKGDAMVEGESKFYMSARCMREVDAIRLCGIKL